MREPCRRRLRNGQGDTRADRTGDRARSGAQGALVGHGLVLRFSACVLMVVGVNLHGHVMVPMPAWLAQHARGQRTPDGEQHDEQKQ
jgi:hypothetical protein